MCCEICFNYSVAFTCTSYGIYIPFIFLDIITSFHIHEAARPTCTHIVLNINIYNKTIINVYI